MQIASSPHAGAALAGPAHSHQSPMDSVIAPKAPASQPVDPAAAAGARPGRQDQAQLDEALRFTMGADADARVSVSSTTNAATFLSGEFGVVVRPGIGGDGPDRIARTFLAQHGRLFGVESQSSQLKLERMEQDDLGMTHYRYQQLHEGLPVFGQEIIVHAQGDHVRSVGGRITPNIQGGTPAIDGTSAATAAIQHTRAALGPATTGTGDLQAIGGQQLGWYTLEDGTPHLAYEVEVGSQQDQRWQMYVDARTGDVLDQWSLVHSVLNRQTVDAKTGQVRSEKDGPTKDAVLNAAHDNAKSVYDYYQSNFNRDSIDGKGMLLKSTVHHGNNYNNAFWNGSSMTYGDGDGVRFTPFGNALDVVAHEMTHGVTERTAGLRYQRQSGALNESWSDTFGNLIEKWAEKTAGKPERDPKWLIGEEIFTPGIEGDALRSQSRPGTGYKGDPQPGHMNQYVETSKDNGGVHINSGIPNRAAYVVAMMIGQEKLSTVWYRALTTYMTSATQFNDAANYTVQSAIDLYGLGSQEARSVARAWKTVGIFPSQLPDVPKKPAAAMPLA